MYEENDLRKTLFFTDILGYPIFVGSYEFKQYALFDGLATDEVYLIRAESNARLNNKDLALQDLNKLLRNRYKTGTYVDKVAVNSEEVLRQIIEERRKELCFRGTRWSDLRRLNKDPRFATTIKRVVDGNTYVLPPNDIRYTLPIPDNEIQLSGIQQNNR
jgi:hypothetical protein